MDLRAGIVILRQGYWASLYIYIKGHWEVWGISQNSIDIDATMSGCGERERERVMWGNWPTPQFPKLGVFGKKNDQLSRVTLGAQCVALGLTLVP